MRKLFPLVAIAMIAALDVRAQESERVLFFDPACLPSFENIAPSSEFDIGHCFTPGAELDVTSIFRKWRVAVDGRTLLGPKSGNGTMKLRVNVVAGGRLYVILFEGVPWSVAP